MKCFLKEFPKDNLPVTRRDKHGRIQKTCNDFSQLPKLDESQKPLLHICKNDGEYCITMKPLKDSKKLITAINPFLDCSPLTFAIRKNPEAIKKHRARKLLNELGFNKKCSCLNLKLCRCRDEVEKRLLAYELKRISDKMNLEKELSFVDLEDSSDSEMNVEFMTPSAMIDSRKLKPNVVHCGTQYSTKDLGSGRCQQLAKDRNTKTDRVIKYGEKDVKGSVSSKTAIPKKLSVKLLKPPLKVSKVKFQANLPLYKRTANNVNSSTDAASKSTQKCVQKCVKVKTFC